MKRKTLMKKLSAVLLSAAMVVSTCSQFSTPVFAADTTKGLPTAEQFATAGQLREFNTDNTDSRRKSAQLYFGNNDQKWWIVGSQSEDSLTLFAECCLAGDEYGEEFEEDTSIKENPVLTDCIYTDGSIPTEVTANHYGTSDVRTVLKGLETSYFTEKEQKLMKETEIYTKDEHNSNVYSTRDKLYLAYGSEANGDIKYITGGKNSKTGLNDGLRIELEYWDTISDYEFWLRTPSAFGNARVLLGNPPVYGVRADSSYNIRGVRPLFELDLTSVLFASVAPAATSEGKLPVSSVFTLRCTTDTLGTAEISYDGTRVNVSGAPQGTYLVVQDGSGAYAKSVSGTCSVTAKEMNRSSFKNCKVWLETTDERVAYATMATEEPEKQEYLIEITENTGLNIASNNGVQKVVPNTSIADIAVEAADGYYLPDGYTDSIQGLNGLTITNITKNGFTISGTPTSDVSITLPPATKKVYNMAFTGNGTFTTTCEGYAPVIANKFMITNNGNVDLENVNVSITGNDADKFELSGDKTTTVSPNGTITVTVKPNDHLPVNTYRAALSVTADHVNAVTTDLQFTVGEHDYNAVVTPPTCIEKGYTTYTCKNCSHSYVEDEVAAKGHTFGEWEIIDAPSCEQGGSRKHTCTVCGFSETENLNPNGHAWENDYTVDKEPTCIEDGSKSIHCENCSAVKDSTTIAKLGHSFTNYVSDGNATCTKDGTKTAKCDRCDETQTIVDVGTMLGHEYEWVFNNDATCEKNGTETGTCKRCQTTVTREKADTALGHEFKNYVSDDNATCTENGTETAKCVRCDKTDTRVQENSALGHKFGEWKVIKDATTTEAGTRERCCERCGYTETEVIPMISGPTHPNGNNSDDKNTSDSDAQNASPKTGDQTNVGFATSMFTMSALGIVALTVLKKKKESERR